VPCLSITLLKHGSMPKGLRSNVQSWPNAFRTMNRKGSRISFGELPTVFRLTSPKDRRARAREIIASSSILRGDLWLRFKPHSRLHETLGICGRQSTDDLKL